MSQDLGPTDPDRLGELMRKRQVELDLTWEAIADRAGLSRTTLTGIRNGKIESTQPRTIRAVERALQWEGGSIAAILAGGDPTTADPNYTADISAVVRASSETAAARPGNTQPSTGDPSPSRATPEEIVLTLDTAAKHDREQKRNGDLFWAVWDVVAEVNHPRRETPSTPARGDRSA